MAVQLQRKLAISKQSIKLVDQENFSQGVRLKIEIRLLCDYNCMFLCVYEFHLLKSYIVTKMHLELTVVSIKTKNGIHPNIFMIYSCFILAVFCIMIDENVNGKFVSRQPAHHQCFDGCIPCNHAGHGPFDISTSLLEQNTGIFCNRLLEY